MKVSSRLEIFHEGTKDIEEKRTKRGKSKGLAKRGPTGDFTARRKGDWKTTMCCVFDREGGNIDKQPNSKAQVGEGLINPMFFKERSSQRYAPLCQKLDAKECLGRSPRAGEINVPSHQGWKGGDIGTRSEL